MKGRYCSPAAALTLLLTLVALSGAREAPAMERSQDPSLVARLDSLMRDAVPRYRLAGVTAAVVRGRDTLLNRGYGYADIGLEVPATSSTRYQVLGEHLAAAVMQQVERGQIRLDDDVTKLIPEFPWQGRRVTLRQLMDATSGLQDYHYLGDAAHKAIGMYMAPDQVTALVAGMPFTHEPGASWQWTITGFHLAGGLVEQLTGASYGDYLKKHVFTPAGLTQTHYCGDRSVVPGLPRTYSASPEGMRFSPARSPTSSPYIATVCTTALDAVKLMLALRDGTLLTRDSWRAMTTPVGAARNAGSLGARGIGLWINQEEGHQWAGEEGAQAFGSAVMDFPQDSLTIAVLTNTSTQAPSTIARNLARLVLGLPTVAGATIAQIAEPRELTPLDSTERRKYVGTFITRRVNPPPQHRNLVRTYRVFEHNNRLLLQAFGAEAEPLFHQEGDVFAVPRGKVTITLNAGKAVAIELAFGNVVYRGEATAQQFGR